MSSTGYIRDFNQIIQINYNINVSKVKAKAVAKINSNIRNTNNKISNP